MEPQEYSVTDPIKVSVFIDNNIGVEYDTDNDTAIMVFDLTLEEHLSILEFIDDNNL